MEIVIYEEFEKANFSNYLNNNGYRWINGKEIKLDDRCFPICIDKDRKTISISNTLFLKEHHKNGGKLISVKEFIKQN